MGAVKTFNNQIKFFEAEAEVKPGENPLDPQIGEHTAAVLVELLGYSVEEVEQLKKDDVIWV